MLVLTRKQGETLVIDGRIEITICPGTTPQHVRIGVDAPLDVTVLRKELIERQREKNASTD